MADHKTPVEIVNASNRYEFTNSAGETYQVRGLSPLTPHKLMTAARAEYARDGKTLPELPTYTVTTAAGDTEVHEHDESTLIDEKDPELTKNNQKEWQEYIKGVSDVNTIYNKKIMRTVLLSVDAEPTQAWRDEMKFIGADAPAENSVEERYLFIETHVIQSASDLSRLTTMVFRAAGIITEAATADVEATFQRFVERAFVEAGKS